MAAKSGAAPPACASDEVAEPGKYAFTVDCRGVGHPAIIVRFRGAAHGPVPRL